MALQNPKYPNSAGRLLTVFQQFQQNQQVIQQLPKLLLDEASPANNNQEQMSKMGIRAIAELHLMYLKFREDMDVADVGEEQRNVLLNGLSAMEQSIYPLAVNANLRPLTDAEKSLLEVCATILPKEGELNPDDIEAISESITVLQNLIDDSNTPDELKIILLELMRLSQDSINRFNIHGANGLKKAFKGMLAEVAELYFSTNEQEKEVIQNTTAWKKITEHLHKFDNLAGRLLKYKPMLENAAKFLLEKQ